MSEPDELLADLTDDQQAAVIHGEGPLLILAGAGSGKTRVITRRVAYLLSQGVRASNILAITFTNKAAGEMKGRVEKLVPGNKVWVSTFHSFGARILRQYAERFGVDRNFTIYDMDDRSKLLKDALEAANLDNVKFSPERIGSEISKAKNKLITPAQYEKQATDFLEKTAATVYRIYDKRLRAANSMDFDDLLYLPAVKLRENDELRRDLDARFQYILIDEYQDTNLAQYQIAKLLSQDHPNLCVVGDPDQCLVPGTLVDTPSGPKPIEQIRDGDEVLSALGGGRVGPAVVDKVMVNPFRGEVLEFILPDGATLRATPNHRFFARWGLAQAEWCDGIRRVQATGSPGSVVFASVAGAAAQVHPRADELLKMFDAALPTDQVTRVRLSGSGAMFACVPADFLRVGCVVPVLRDGTVADEEIIGLGRIEYDGPVYDLSVPSTRNFVANGVVVHNSIYKWRHADIKNILDFERDFRDTRVITLDRNYRSTKNIIHAANTVIAHNKQRKKKSLVTHNEDGDPVRVLTFDHGLEEAEGVAKRIKETVKSGKFAYRDHAIFMRINALTRSLEGAFVKHGVPYQIVRGLAFYERKENRDVIAYLRLLVNPADSVSFSRIVNEPARGIGKVSLDKLQSFADKNEIGLLAAAGQVGSIPEIKGKGATGLRDFHKMMTDLRAKLDIPPHDLVSHVLEKSGYEAMLRNSTEEDDADRLANVGELITAVKQFWDEDNTRSIGDFLETITLASDVDGWDQETDHVSIMTLHASKGLEFPVVYILAVEEGLLPHERSMGNPEEVEEERRLCFVGMTRAMKELYLSSVRLRAFRGKENYCMESSFLRELPRDGVERIDVSRALNYAGTAADEYRAKIGPAASDWADTGARPYIPPAKSRTEIKPSIPDSVGPAALEAGAVVQHEQYGLGKVEEVSGYGAFRKVKIRFPGAGEKVFVVDQVKLKIVGRKKAEG